MEIGGKVWVDVGATKESNLNGRLHVGEADVNDTMFAGMQVDLHLGDANGQIVATTTTDSEGNYHFYNLDALEKYTVVFTFNGQIYQQTYYKDNLSGGYSNAQEIDRSGFNDRFDKIDSYPNNYDYGGWHAAYGLEVKLKDANGNYIANGQDEDGNNLALTYSDAWNQFLVCATEDKSYEAAYNSLQSWLQSRGVGETDINGVIQYIKDCMISANTRQYPVYDQFVIENIEDPASQPETETAVGRTWNSLYTSASDQSRNVDFGINERGTADLIIQKDVFKATVRVNGKTQTYAYSNKDLSEDGAWEIEIRAADALYNGETRYTREIRKSEYLYDGTIYSTGGTSAKDLKVYITYRIAVRNQSQTYDTVLNEIVDYYDASEYVFDGTLSGNTFTPNEYSDFENSTITSYIGDVNGNYVAPIVVKTESSLGNNRGNTDIGHGYMSEDGSDSPLYISGAQQDVNGDTLTPIVMPVLNEQGEVSGTSAEITKGGGMTYIFLTFEVKKAQDENGMANRVKMDIDVSTGEDKGVGKQNIAEINGYSTYYGDGETVPGTLNADDTVNNIDVNGQKGGYIDTDSTVGNLSAQDINDVGDLILTDDPLTNRTEDDTDKAPNVRLIFPVDSDEPDDPDEPGPDDPDEPGEPEPDDPDEPDTPNDEDQYERVARGYVFEDNRTEESEKAMVGNGRYDESETKINGVTVQLVELIQDVDEDGIPVRDENGNYAYLGEYIWTPRKWENGQWVNAASSTNSGSTRYYSGQGNYEDDHTVAPIISGAGATEISGYTFEDDSTGEYALKGVPAGDYIIRFIYGDTTQTVLTTSDDNAEGKEVVELLNGQNPDNESGYISTSGLNLKSYNGQDYKSTTYQPDITQEGSYNDVYGYGYDANGLNEEKYDTQNYNYTKDAQPEEAVVGEAISNYVNTTDGIDKTINYYYNIAESQVQTGASDAKDVGNTRTDANEYSKGLAGIDGAGEDEKTLVNGRSEVLASGLKVASTDNLEEGATVSPEKQVAMLKELMSNTSIVSQSGVINTEIEWNTTHTDNQETNNAKDYVLEDIDLGLSERPVAQLKMNKEVSNVKITLQDGSILFDTNRPVTNMSYAAHQGHTVTYDPEDPNGSAYRLISVAIANNTTSTPELITTYMDEELMYGARIEVDYTFTITNVGEVDYLDNKFYYTGVTNDTSAENISTTTANTIVDYVTNNIQFLPTHEKNETWSIRTVEDLTSNPADESTDYGTNPVGNNDDLINNRYYDTLNTYNAIVTNKKVGEVALYPEAANIEEEGSTEENADTQEGAEGEENQGPQSSVQATMMLSSTLTPDSGEDTMVYNNLSEIVQVSNTQGRRLKWSITGNQPMSNQDYGSDIPADEETGIYTRVDLVTPTEIDSDSSQEVLILPPTGSDRNYTLWIIVGVVALAIIAGGVILIRRYFKKK